MSARFLLVIFDSVYVLALACWVGSLLFFIFGVTPVVARMLSDGDGSGPRLIRALFPRFYTWAAISGSIALPAYLGVPLSFDEYRGPLVAVQAGLILAVTLMMLYGANSLTPALIAPGPDEAPRAERLLRRSVWLNSVALLLAMILLVALANRPAPTTAGIIEPTPVERARAEYEKAARQASERLRRARSQPESSSPAPREGRANPR